MRPHPFLKAPYSTYRNCGDIIIIIFFNAVLLLKQKKTISQQEIIFMFIMVTKKNNNESNLEWGGEGALPDLDGLLLFTFLLSSVE